MNAIVLIDDQPISNFITKKVLEVYGVDKKVVDYTNPVEAFQALSFQNNLILFLDLSMPGMSGWEFLDKMKENNLNYNTILLTASDKSEDLEKSKEYPCVKGFLTKPLNLEKFRNMFPDSDFFNQSTLN